MKAEASQSFFVTITTPKGSTTKRVEGDLLSVGRAQDCNLSIAHDSMSRRHLSVSLRQSICYVEDHGSANGSFLNGQRLKAHTPVKLLPDDEITLAQSGVKIAVSINPAPAEKSLTNSRPESVSFREETIVTSTHLEREKELRAELPEARSAPENQQYSESIVLEAYKKASDLIREAELEAEKRSEEIYKRAHEVQAKTDINYQRRMNEAYRASEAVFTNAQSEAQTLLEAARVRSEDLRRQAENFVADLRQRTEADCEHILNEAQITARELKESRIREAEENAKLKEKEMIERTRLAMNERVARFEEDLTKKSERQQQLLERDYKERSEMIEKVKQEIQQLIEQRNRDQQALTDLRKTIEAEREQARLAREELGRIQAEMNEHRRKVQELRTEASLLEKEKAENQRLLKSTSEQIGRSNDEIRTAKNRVKEVEKQVESEIMQIRSKSEEDKGRIIQAEREALEALKFETNKQVKHLEQQLYFELENKKDRMSREILLTVDTFLKQVPEAKGAKSKQFKDDLGRILEAEIKTLGKDSVSKKQTGTLQSSRRRERTISLTLGIVLGLGLFYGALHLEKMPWSNAPLQRQIASEVEEKRADLERRKFNPPQSPEYRDSYVDNVIYCDGFVSAYTSEAFQKQFLRELSPHLLKTFRLDETKAVEAIATATTLVKELDEKKQAIHPDFVPQGLEKMRGFEEDSLKKLRTILGSNVRVEAFRKKEAQFFAKFKHRAVSSVPNNVQELEESLERDNDKEEDSDEQ